MLKVPKWDPLSDDPIPMVAYDQAFDCYATDDNVIPGDCLLTKGEQFDEITIKNAFATDIAAGETLSFEFGPARNPISTARKYGF